VKLAYPCPPYNSIINPFNGPPSVAGQLKHAAVDFPARDGTPLLSPIAGKVTFAGQADENTGIMIEVSAGGFSVRMLHLQSLCVQVSEAVGECQHIGFTNNTGLTTGPHLHMAVWCDTKELALTVQPDPVLAYGRWAVDPEKLLTKEDDDFMAALTEEEQRLILENAKFWMAKASWSGRDETRAEAAMRALGELDCDAQGTLFPRLKSIEAAVKNASNGTPAGVQTFKGTFAADLGG
jgi:hypothetical protein